jgi:hypothetical protein
LGSRSRNGRQPEWKGKGRESNESDEWSLGAFSRLDIEMSLNRLSAADMDPFASKPQPGLGRDKNRGTFARSASGPPRLGPPTMPDLTSRSLFVRSRNKLFPKSTSRGSPPRARPASPAPPSLVFDIQPRTSGTIDEREEEEEIELGRLRDAAARSLGVSQSPMNDDLPVCHFCVYSRTIAHIHIYS